MSRDHLAKRGNWQEGSAARGQGAEDVFHALLSMHLRDGAFDTVKKPRDLKGIYGVRTSGRSHGIVPEYAIRHRRTGRTMFVEIKRQRAAGNAHERACRYFAPGIVASARQIAKLSEGEFPFWCIFTNGIASDPNYRQEIQHWFRGYEPHLLFWKNVNDHDVVLNHFDEHILPILRP